MADAGDIIIRFEDVDKAFGRNVIYEGLNLEVRRGETMTIVGGSGTGKSVCLKMLIGLLSISGGSIWVEDMDVATLSGDWEFLPIRRKISMLFQGAALFDSLTVGENIAYPLHEHLKLSDDEIAERVAEKLALVGLPGVEQMAPAELSGGMKKRVGLARAIAINPEVILWDEPTTGLDPSNTMRINELIVDMQKKLGVTSIVVTHDVGTVMHVSDRIALLENRAIDTVLTVDEVRADSDSSLARFLDGRLNL